MAPMPHSARPDLCLSPNFALILRESAERDAGRAAIVERGDDGVRPTTYVELASRAAGVAAALAARGVAPGDRVVILMHRGAGAAAAFFGTLACGGVAVIANETLRPRQLEHILAHAGAKVMLHSADLVEMLPRSLQTDALLLDAESIPGGGALRPVERTGQDVAQIIYTSGSTGSPKGVTLSHANLWAGARAVTSYVGITSADRLASLLPFSFDYGFNQLLCAVLAGATLVVERSPMAQQIALTIREQRVSVLACVPPLWLQLLAAPDFTAAPLPALRAMTNTGGRLPVDAVRRLRAAHPHAQLFLMYGLTEAFRATYLPPDEADAHPDSIGRAIPGAEIMVLRPDGTECGPDEEGELVQRGPTVALGYWNDPETTARVYRPNPRRPAGAPDAERVVYSGDVVRRDAEGRLYYVGRRDSIIKTLGFRVNPDEVCEVMYASGEVAEAVVAAEPDEQRGSRIVAYCVLREQGDLGRLQRFCRVELPRYMQPARYEVVGAIARTSSGKFDVRETARLAAVPSQVAEAVGT